MYRLALFGDLHLEKVSEIPGVVEAVEQVFGDGADHVAFAGDIVDAAQTEVVASLVNRLRRLGLGPTKVSLVPGNHDTFALSEPLTAEKLWRAAVARDSQRNYEQFCQLVAPLVAEAPGELLLPPATFPFGKRLSRHVALVGLDTVRGGTRLPTEWATGQLDEEAADAMKEYFDQHADAVHGVVLMHHSPLDDVPPVEGIELRFADPSPDIVRNWLAWAGVTLVLCGHSHEQRVVRCEEGFAVVEHESMSDDPPYRIVELGPRGGVNTRR